MYFKGCMIPLQMKILRTYIFSSQNIKVYFQHNVTKSVMIYWPGSYNPRIQGFSVRPENSRWTNCCPNALISAHPLTLENVWRTGAPKPPTSHLEMHLEPHLHTYRPRFAHFHLMPALINLRRTHAALLSLERCCRRRNSR